MSLLEKLLRNWPRLPQITADDLQGRLHSALPPLLLDVRTPLEYAAGHISGAINIPHEQVLARVAELIAHKDRDIIIYCRSGMRASQAARALQQHGFVRLAFLSGHMQGWHANGRPVHRHH
jgi:rhodanese-related sulfurtransferase